MGLVKVKDWTGDTHATFVTLGASNHTDDERADGDFYATPPLAIHALADVGKFPRNKSVWEAACGAGHLSKVLEEYGYNVISTDLYDRGYGESGVDFLAQTELRAPCILTNPPYKFALEFAEHAVHRLKCDEYYAFLKLTFLEGQKRGVFFDEYPPSEILVFRKRVQVARNGDPEEFKKSSAACYAWFIWRKNSVELPIVSWI
jgi:hypothetical protein